MLQSSMSQLELPVINVPHLVKFSRLYLEETKELLHVQIFLDFVLMKVNVQVIALEEELVKIQLVCVGMDFQVLIVQNQQLEQLF